MGGDFTFGIEEEYFLVDAETKLVARRMPEAFLVAAQAATNGRVSGEFLQSQIEVASSTPEELGLRMRTDAEKWGGIIRSIGIAPQ